MIIQNRIQYTITTKGPAKNLASIPSPSLAHLTMKSKILACMRMDFTKQ